MVSEIGIDHHTPSTPMNLGSMSSMGKRNSICLDSERNMLIFAFPMLWKKFVITICDPTSMNAAIIILSPFTERSMSCWSVVKSRAQGPGISSATRNPIVVITVPAIVARLSTRISLSSFCAP